MIHIYMVPKFDLDIKINHGFCLSSTKEQVVRVCGLDVRLTSIVDKCSELSAEGLGKDRSTAT